MDWCSGPGDDKHEEKDPETLNESELTGHQPEDDPLIALFHYQDDLRLAGVNGGSSDPEYSFEEKDQRNFLYNEISIRRYPFSIARSLR